MIAETVVALFVAHVLADYVLQTKWMVDTKRGPGFAVHIGIVFATAALCLGQISVAILLITLAHCLIDATKTLVLPDSLWSYLADQLLHLASIMAVGSLFPGAWQAGIWADMLPPGSREVVAALAGLVFTIRAGHFAIAIYLVDPPREDHGFARNRAALTGALERTAVYALVLGGFAALSLVVLAVKALLWWAMGGRHADGWQRAVAGTLASFAFAIAVGYGTMMLISMP
jgi:hypothetical protein